MFKRCQVLVVVCCSFVAILGSWACVAPLKARADATGDAGGGASGDAQADLEGDTVGQGDALGDRESDAGTDRESDATDRESDAGTDRESDVGHPSDAPLVCAGCTAWGASQPEGPSPSQLPELSGLAASRLHPGLLYAHNDSGDTARFFALTAQAVVNAEMHLAGATATDWEDISVGPCPTGSCVYIGDTGDNKADRTQYVIYRLPEPATLPTDGSVVTITSYESFPFIYPDGPHNAETLLVHPVTGQIFVVIKEAGIFATVYEMPQPLTAGQEVTLTRFSALTLAPTEGVVTDGSFHPCGDRLLVRTTGAIGLFEMTRAAGASMTSLFTATPVRVPVAAEPQGEAVTYSLDGRSYFTGSETVSGSPVPSLSMVTCTAY